jgi:hypothetical protein
METRESENAGRIALGRRYWDTPVNLNVKRYTRYCRRLDRQLLKLEKHWAHLAVPMMALRGSFDGKPVK